MPHYAVKKGPTLSDLPIIGLLVADGGVQTVTRCHGCGALVEEDLAGRHAQYHAGFAALSQSMRLMAGRLNSIGQGMDEVAVLLSGQAQDVSRSEGPARPRPRR